MQGGDFENEEKEVHVRISSHINSFLIDNHKYCSYEVCSF